MSHASILEISPRSMGRLSFDLDFGLEVFSRTAATRSGTSASKRVIDVAVALLLLALLSPLLLLVALLVRLTSSGPAFFRQKRVGLGCRVFSMWKFRTMVRDAAASESELAREGSRGTFFKIRNDPRVTPLGRFLRKYSIDELPQLWNVLRGDMSLIGPRPILLREFHRFPLKRQMRRFAVLPGMTGLWQVSGRSDSSEESRMQLDLRYVDRWSLALDVEILARTLPVVMRGTGAV